MPEAETEQARDRKAIELAEARGRRQQEVNGRLLEHDQRFARINGSIDRSARAQEALEKRLKGVEGKVDGVIQRIETEAAVQAARAKDAISRRDWWRGIGVIALGLATLIGTVIAVVH